MQVKVALLFLVLSLAPAWAAPEAGLYALAGERAEARVSVAGPVGRVSASVPVDGDLRLGRGGRITGGRVVLDLAALRADPLMAAALRGPDGFDVARHPRASYTVTGGSIAGDRIALEGRLSVRGTERALALTGEIRRARGDRFTALLDGAFDRTLFGITVGRPLYGREATVRVRIVAER